MTRGRRSGRATRGGTRSGGAGGRRSSRSGRSTPVGRQGGTAADGSTPYGGGKARAAAIGLDAAPIAGVVTRRGKHLEIDPLFQSGSPMLVAREGLRVRPGDLVLYTYSHGRRASVTRILGERGVLADVLEALLLDNLVERGFGEKVLAEAADAAQLAQRKDSYRADLRDLFTFTVDPEEAKDFDDALSFEEGPGIIVVYVHIADVSYYVHESGLVDREALRRGTSVYVPGSVEPMLPDLLSSGVCSLQPDAERKAVTVEMEVEPDGRVRDVRFYRSLIRSDVRLHYEQLETYMRQERPTPPALQRALSLGWPLSRTIRERRYDRGALRVTSIEPEFHWDGGTAVDAHPAQELESHCFIEDYMVLANEQVASFLERERVPLVYRVHQLPDPFHLDHLLDLLASLELPTPPFDPTVATPGDIRRTMLETAAWVDRFTPKNRGKAALVQQVLRAQSRAVYDTDNMGHFGLASSSYCHFTSPIRRYPDLLVHRALVAHLGVGPEPTTSTLSEWAEHCSRMEREAAKVELKADDIVLAHVLRRRLEVEGWNATFDGQILSFVRSGAFLLFGQVHQGFLPARDLPGDYYELNDLESAMIGRDTGAAYRLADIVPVRVAGIDEARGRVDLTLAED